jgi:hypothetical protein
MASFVKHKKKLLLQQKIGIVKHKKKLLLQQKRGIVKHKNKNNNVLLLQQQQIALILLPKCDPLIKILIWRIKALILLPHHHWLLLPLSLWVATIDMRTILVVVFWNILLETSVKKNILIIDLVECARVQI